MKAFKDNLGREWRITFDKAAVERVRLDTGIDLSGDSAAQFERLADDPEMLACVLWSCIEPQADALGVEPEDFGRSINLEAATDALRGSIIEAQPRRVQKQLRKFSYGG